MVEEVRLKRDTLHTDAMALVQRKLMNPDLLAPLTSSIGHRAITYDVITLCMAFRTSWPKVEGKTALSWDELVATHARAEEVGKIVSFKEISEKTKGEAVDDRQRAFTLMARSYDELRRAVVYVRWPDGDADDFVPSLAANRGRSRAKEDAATELPVVPAEDGAPVVPSPTVGAPVGGASPFGSPFTDS